MHRTLPIDAMTWSGRCTLAAATKGVLHALDLMHDTYAGSESQTSIFRTMRSVLLEGLSKLTRRSSSARLSSSESLLLWTTMGAALRAAELDQEDSAIVDLQRLRSTMPALTFGRVPRERAIDFVVRHFLRRDDVLVHFLRIAAQAGQIGAA